MKCYLLLLVFFLSFGIGRAQNLKPDQLELVQSFVDCIKSDDTLKLKSLIIYPLKRTYPLTDVNDTTDFVNKMGEIFDYDLVNKLLKSNPSEDWSLVHAEGITFKKGLIWMNSKGEITAINNLSGPSTSMNLASQGNTQNKGTATTTTTTGSEVKETPVTEGGNLDNGIVNTVGFNVENEPVHESLKKYESGVFTLETEKFRVRVDELKDGTLRYAAWYVSASMLDKPNIILNNGVRVSDGADGSHWFKFTNGSYIYLCIIYTDNKPYKPPAELVVLRREREIVEEHVTKLSYPTGVHGLKAVR